MVHMDVYNRCPSHTYMYSAAIGRSRQINILVYRLNVYLKKEDLNTMKIENLMNED